MVSFLLVICALALGALLIYMLAWQSELERHERQAAALLAEVRELRAQLDHALLEAGYWRAVVYPIADLPPVTFGGRPPPPLELE